MPNSCFVGKMITIIVILFFFLRAGAHASSMAAWTTSFGSSVIKFNDSTNIFSSSLCNSSTLVFPVDPPNVLDTGTLPHNGTSIAATGYLAGNVSWATLFFVGEDEKIIHELYSCNNSTGAYVRQGTWALDVLDNSAQTGLAVILLDDEKPEFKLTYSDSHNHIRQGIVDTHGSNQWDETGVVTQDKRVTAHILGAAGSSASDNSTYSVVVAPRDNNIEFMDLDAMNNWQIMTFPQSLARHYNQFDVEASFGYSHDTPPFTLPAWDGHTRALGLALDSTYQYHLFYIGDDKHLHHAMTGPPDIWSLMEDQDVSSWPVADYENADLAAVYTIENATISVYYISGGALVETIYQDEKWLAAVPVPVTYPRHYKSNLVFAILLGLGCFFAFCLFCWFTDVMCKRQRASGRLDAEIELGIFRHSQLRPSPLPGDRSSMGVSSTGLSSMDRPSTARPRNEVVSATTTLAPPPSPAPNDPKGKGKATADPARRHGMIWPSDSDDGDNEINALPPRWKLARSLSMADFDTTRMPHSTEQPTSNTTGRLPDTNSESIADLAPAASDDRSLHDEAGPSNSGHQ